MDWVDLFQDRDNVAGTCKCDDEPSVSINSREFLDELRTG
jgi:hypothetical protein